MGPQREQSSSLQACVAPPYLSLTSGILTDQLGRTCSIVSNSQFQCDPGQTPDGKPGQVNALKTSGWNICPSSTTGGGGGGGAPELKTEASQKTWYVCRTGDGSGKKWWNIYGETLHPDLAGAQGHCTVAKVEVRPCDNSTAAPTEQGAGEKRDLGERALEDVQRDAHMLAGRAWVAPREVGGVAEEQPGPVVVKRDVMPKLQGRTPFPIEKAGKMWWPMPKK